ncbi:MAG: crossover junction endodeoxyribonuclease RuvC [Armatimonadetes bacterium]|nr:crossover junction endodeoxyribonuclease RuvC [Armatimonadota bacterium]
MTAAVTAPAFVALGFDPGLVATGYGALAAGPRGAVLREAGVIRSRPQLSLEVRILEIYRETHVVLEEIGPDVIVLEDVFMHPHFPQSAITLAHVRGALCVAAAERGVPVESLAPAAVKRAVSGNGRAPKAQMQGVVARLLRISGSPSAHAADALALAIAAMSRRGYPLAEPGRPA